MIATFNSWLRRPLLASVLLLLCLGPARAQQADAAMQLVKQAESKLDTFLTADHWASVRNLAGIARAIVIVPSGGQAGLVVGGQWGKGILLVRNEHQWSDPLFVKLFSWQVGLLVGGQSVNGIGAILSGPALDRTLAGKFRIGGSADATIVKGLSGKAAGGAGGIEFLMVSSNKGVYLGGSLEGVRLRLDDKLNRQAYGEDFDVATLLADTDGGQYPAADPIRARLSETAYNAVFDPE